MNLAGTGSARNGMADIAKGVAILLMIQVHLTQLFGRQQFLDSLAGHISLFLGGPPVAPLFMVVLGYFLAASKKQLLALALRGFILLMVAYGLNLGLNAHLLIRINNGTILLNPWPYVFGVDILFLAAFSVIITALLRQIIPNNAALYIGLAVCIASTTGLVNRSIAEGEMSPYLTAYVGGSANWSYFPLFPWLAYPLLGYGAFLLRDTIELIVTSPKRRWIIVGLLAVACALTSTYGVSGAADLPHYYHHGLGYFAWTIMFLAFWVTGLSLIDAHAGSFFIARYLKWLGENVTYTYVIQWLLIGNIATAIYKTQSLPKMVVWYVVILAVVTTLVWQIRARGDTIFHSPK